MTVPVVMFMNMKGGVGKTTLAVEVSRTLAHKYSKEVLLIDYDPQANASFAFLETSEYFELLEDGVSLADCLMPSIKDNDPFEAVGVSFASKVDVRQYYQLVRDWNDSDSATEEGKLFVVPGALSMMRLALNVLSAETEDKLHLRWNGLIKSARKYFDCIVIDCHPAGSFFTKSALLASDAVIIPVTSDAFAATGLNMMRQHMQMWQNAGGAKEFLVVFNDSNNSWDTDVELRIRQDSRFASHCLAARVRYSKILGKIAQRRQTSAEQRVPYSRRVAENISEVSEEIVTLLKEKQLFDSSW